MTDLTGIIGFGVVASTQLWQIAQGTSSDTPAAGFQFDAITPFLNLGLIGVLFLMFIARKGIVPEWVLKQAEERHQREIEAKDADLAEMKRLLTDSTKLYNEQVVPAFTRSIDVNREYVDLLRQQQEPPPPPPPRRRKPPAR